MNFIISKCHIISKNPVSDVKSDPFWPCSDFECNKNFEIADFVIFVAPDSFSMVDSIVYINLMLENQKK